MTRFVTAAAVDNAITTVLALGGSTNAVVHLVAVARRAGIALSIDRFDELARRTPLVANIRPAGKYLMEDLYYAGGLRALLGQMKAHLHLDRITVTGRTLGENLEGAKVHNEDVIRSLSDHQNRRAVALDEMLAVLTWLKNPEPVAARAEISTA